MSEEAIQPQEEKDLQTEVKNGETENLILGKFKSYEDLEKSYTELQASFSSKSNFEKMYNSELEKNKVPDEYVASGDLLDLEPSVLRGMAEEAKKLNLTQEQFNKYAQDRKQKNNAAKDEKDEVNAPIISDALKKHLISDYNFNEGMLKAMGKAEIDKYEKNYQESLNTNTRVSSTSSSEIITRDTVRKLYGEMQAARGGNINEYNAAFEKWLNASEKSRR